MAYNHIQETTRFDVLSVGQRGRGPKAELVTSSIKSLSCENVYDILGDYAIMTYPDFVYPYHNVNILNWRTSSSTRHAKSTFNAKLANVRFDLFRTIFAKVLLKDVQLLPKTLEDSPADENLQQPIWTAWLNPQVQNDSIVKL